MHPPDQLGRGSARADGQSGHKGSLQGMSARSVVNRLGWVVVTIILVSAFWVFYYNIGLGGGGDEIMVAGEKKVVDPEGAPPVVVAEAVVVGPAGLAIPVCASGV